MPDPNPRTALVLLLLAPLTAGQDPTLDTLTERLAELERQTTELRSMLETQRAAAAATEAAQDETTEALLDEIEALQSGAGGDRWFDRFTLGGYGEHHLNFNEGSGGDLSDIHRFVLYMGYRFSENLRLHSETEIEHAFVEDDNGLVAIEQLYAELDLGNDRHLLMGRVLAPIGILNERHEPPTFNGVERPNVEKYVIPSTWSVDGIGLAGALSEDVGYQLYAVGGLDGTGFSDTSGIRGGRIKERPSLNEVALTGRLDWTPIRAMASETPQDLRLGASFFLGGHDNGNKGKDPGVDGDVALLSADFEYSRGDFDLRGVFATIDVSGADDLNTALIDPDTGEDPGIADTIQGWYLEGAYHLMPDSWRAGVLERGDLVAFARYEDFDTQHDLGSVATANPKADREDITLGLGLYITPQFVIKADYQFRDDGTGDRPDGFNLGFGYQF